MSKQESSHLHRMVDDELDILSRRKDLPAREYVEVRDHLLAEKWRLTVKLLFQER